MTSFLEGEKISVLFHSHTTIIIIAHSGLQWVPIPPIQHYKTFLKVLINPNFWSNIYSVQQDSGDQPQNFFFSAGFSLLINGLVCFFY
jgi:hypothetical protein